MFAAKPFDKPSPAGVSTLKWTNVLFAGALAASALAGLTRAHAQTALPSTGLRAVTTYEAAGLYWSAPGGTAGCQVKYRKVGETAWKDGLDLWYDARNNECRGSVVHLAPDTSYEANFNLPGQAASKALIFKTWANTMPVARTVAVASGSNTLNITEGGTAAGYVVYDGNGATLDAANGKTNNITVNASYVIIRRLVLKGAMQDAIRISPNVKDVIIEDNEITGWGRLRSGTWGVDMDSAVRAVCSTPTLERVTIQRNKMHDPRYGANSWSDGHPAGPQAITISYCGGNHVIRWNEMYSSAGKYFNDVIGGEDNFTDTGFPHSDTDIYANRIENAWDDGIEAEGANRNVRIWGNYINNTAIGIATTVTATGPVYVFRNVWNRARMYEKTALDSDDRQPLFKSGSYAPLGDGRRYLLHNTMLQATQSGVTGTLGGGFGTGGTGSTQLINNTWSINNIYHTWKAGGANYQTGVNNKYSNDLYSGNAGSASYSNGMQGIPVYLAGHGWTSESGGKYQLASTSPGFDKGLRLNNFNDAFSGAAPDVGASESGLATMAFGLAGATATAPTAPVEPTPTPAPSGGTSILSPGGPLLPPAPVEPAPTAPTAPAGSCTAAAADWMVVADPLAARIKPTDCTAVEQSPPDFGWPDASTDARYQITLTYPDGRTRTLATQQNWFNWDEVLPAGTYKWSVQLSNAAGTKQSSPRTFTVGANAVAFRVPDGNTLLATVQGKAHPRGMPDAAALAAMKAERSAAIATLAADVANRATSALPAAPTSSVEDWARDEARRTMNALMAYAFNKDSVSLADAIRRTVNLATWDPNGATSYANHDMASRVIAWQLAVSYDWLAPSLTAAQKSTILNALKIRGAAMHNDIIGTRSRIAKYPRDSHANQTLMLHAVISTLVAGDLPEASTWLVNTLPLAANAASPWGGEDGGFANSASQGVWDMGEQLFPLYALRWASGLDIGQKAWVRNWAKYAAYMMPPGSPTQVFGDGLEMNLAGSRANVAQGHARFSPSPMSRWLATASTGADPLRAEVLFAPPADFTAAALPSGTANGALFASIGWMASHSNLADNARTSVYFKSSPAPFGAFNHSHADNNSFVINAGGQRLAIESGYYDGYKTAHWTGWYKTTKAKNAITFDGGQGQVFYEKDGQMGTGRVTQHASAAGYDLVTGDATASYGGALSKATRSMVHLRPNLVLVYDNLASATARTWEWNIHAVKAMNVISGSKVSIANGGQTLCVDVLHGPGRTFSQTELFSTAPSGGQANQWHGKFATAEKSTAAEFVVLLNIGCTGTTGSATKSSGAWTINVGSQVVKIDAAGTVAVQ